MPASREFYLKPRVTRLPLPRPPWPTVWMITCRACDRRDAATSFLLAQLRAADHQSKPRQAMSGEVLPPLPCTPTTRIQRAIEQQIDVWLPALQRLAEL